MICILLKPTYLWTNFCNIFFVRSSNALFMCLTIATTNQTHNNYLHFSAVLTKNDNLLKLCRKYLASFSARQFYLQFIHTQFMRGMQVSTSLCWNRLIGKLNLTQKSALRVLADTHYIPFHFIPSADIVDHLKYYLSQFCVNMLSLSLHLKFLTVVVQTTFTIFFSYRYPKRDTFFTHALW